MLKSGKLLLGWFFLFSSSLFSSYSSGDQPYNYKIHKGYPAEPDYISEAYNAQARFDVCGKWDFYISGTFILWQPKEQGLDIALISSIYAPTNNPAYNLNTKFDYDPGFKIEVGGYAPHDNWMLALEYLNLMTESNSRKTVNPSINQITNYWRIGSSISNLADISLAWHLKLNILNLSLGRPFYTGTALIFNPYIGINGGEINQKIYLSYATADNVLYNTEICSNSWFIGPRAGIDTNWLLAEKFRFFGKAAASLNYQCFDLLAKEFTNSSPSQFSTNTKDNDYHINAKLDLSFGFGWGSYLARKKLHFDFIAGYELQTLWKQNLMRTLIEEIKNKICSKPGTLSPHGFVFAARLDF